MAGLPAGSTRSRMTHKRHRQRFGHRRLPSCAQPQFLLQGRVMSASESRMFLDFGLFVVNAKCRDVPY
jgi:hypothetical protein